VSTYHFDADRADHAIRFMECLKQSKGEWAGQPLELMPWQREVTAKVFGQVDEDGHRQYRTVFVFVPRKQGKTWWAAAVANYLAYADGEKGAEVYVAAHDRDQAAICWGAAGSMVRSSPELNAMSKIVDHTKRIVIPGTESFIRAIASDAAGSHGFNAHGIIFDEFHTQRTSDLFDVLMTSTAARRQPLVFIITTAGVYSPESPCVRLYEYAKRVESGEIVDETFLPVIYEADAEAEWDNPATWAQANPSLGVTVQLDYLEREAVKARELPSYRNTFETLHLCRWVQQETRWINPELWDSANGAVSETELLGRECFAGLDLSSTTDLSALALVFPADDGSYDVLMRFWCPGDGVHKRSRVDAVPYDAWERDGHLIATEGAVVDYDEIRAEVGRLGERFNLREIAIDRWAATQISTQLDGDGFTVVPFGQGFASMSAPTKELEKLLIGKQLRHGGQPVLRWMASNVAVKGDAAGNIKPAKDRSNGRIDGIVALIMGLGRASLRTDEKPFVSVYEDREMLILGDDDDDF
jgi:phage terminase large subunit-like protein